MNPIIVVDSPRDWRLDIPGARVVSPRQYLTDPAESGDHGAKVFNLCRSYRYQSAGYYVSLLAEARNQRPLPSIEAIQGLRMASIVRLASRDVHDLMQSGLRSLRSERFELSIYFGRNVARKYDSLALALFNAFPAPMLRATFERDDDEWRLAGLRAIGMGDVPESHHAFFTEQAQRYLRRAPGRRAAKPARYDLAILHDPEEALPPSDEDALKRMVQAGEAKGVHCELIGRDAYGRLAEFDALFIRETTAVNHPTYRFARRAEALGLVVVDDPMSIVRCTNKVYLAEMLSRHRLRAPRTVIFARDGIDAVPDAVGLPCVLKQPDSAFSAGVVKAVDRQGLEEATERLFATTDLLIAQEFLPTDFDWRIGVLGGEPLFACRYYMAKDHWQIIKRDADGVHEGAWETVDLADAPTEVLRLATRASNAIGDGLYGVDIKVAGGKPYVIEVNDNPNIDGDVEDAVLGMALYEKIMDWFLQRMEGRGR